MDHATFLIALADDLILSRPDDAKRLLEISHDHRRMTEALDDLIGSAIAEARREVAEIETRTADELAKICRGHTR